MPKKEDCFENPEKFDLENFTESESLNKFGFIGFGQGPRNCIGINNPFYEVKFHNLSIFRYEICSADS